MWLTQGPDASVEQPIKNQFMCEETSDIHDTSLQHIMNCDVVFRMDCRQSLVVVPQLDEHMCKDTYAPIHWMLGFAAPKSLSVGLFAQTLVLGFARDGARYENICPRCGYSFLLTMLLEKASVCPIG